MIYISPISGGEAPAVNIDPNIIGKVLTPGLIGGLAKAFVVLLIIGLVLYGLYKIVSWVS